MFSTIFLLAAAVASVTALPQSGDPVDNGPISGPFLPNGTGPGDCTSEYRVAGAQQVVFAYNLIQPFESEEAFQRVPFRDDCQIQINPNGGPAIPVAVDRTTSYDFAVATRQVFSRVTGLYTDFDNGTTIITTNVTLGVLHGLALPITFSADVYLTYDLSQCLIENVQAFATIPTQIAGIDIQPPILDMLLGASELYDGENLPF
ncbi:hypothetical protein CB0940_06995 [Cercospora beticola]|uniref:Uncharacterized protein n=1 Tax=Cercospora beticola TaxID=122368 RepID=A0A2G5H8E1_CERBT|nr:hypothetical protein CB0940_06995 [Cercospora beticola]PIA88799.1 hypothetical protein CB0940_06995 [Cercospora beticola]WPB02915.1 hypothetical protein RHO25_007551 [Cercospora beticola]